MLPGRAKDGKPELDFETDPSDFRLPSIQIEELKKGLRSSGSLRAEENIPDMHYSLRVSAETVCHNRLREPWRHEGILIEIVESPIKQSESRHYLSFFPSFLLQTVWEHYTHYLKKFCHL